MSRYLVMVTDNPVHYEDLAYILPINQEVTLSIRKMLDVAGGVSIMMPMEDMGFRDLLGRWSALDLEDSQPYDRPLIREARRDGFCVVTRAPNMLPETIENPCIRVFPEEQVVRFECMVDDHHYYVDIDANHLEEVLNQPEEQVSRPLRPDDLLATKET